MILIVLNSSVFQLPAVPIRLVIIIAVIAKIAEYNHAFGDISIFFIYLID